MSGKDIESIENVIINGDFHVAQQGTSFPAVNAYTLDQWSFSNNTGAAYTVSQSADIPSVAQAGIHAGNSLTAACTTAATSFASGTGAYIAQPIKGSRFRKIAQKNFVLSFWVNSTRIGTYCVSFRNLGGDQFYVAEYTINAANTWERKIVVVPSSPIAGTWDYANGAGLYVFWTLAGAPNTVSPNNWSSVAQHYTANQVNHAQAVGNTFRLALVKIEPGIVATPFPVRDDLLLCQEYYCRMSLSASMYASTAGEQLQQTVHLPTVMRATPSTALVSAGIRSNLSGFGVTMYSRREGSFYIGGAAGSALFYALNDLWEFNARL
jgi:hypothetical protein